MGKAKKVGIGVGIAVVAFFGIAIAAAVLSTNQGTSSYNPTVQTVEDISVNTSVQTEISSQAVRIYDLTFRLVNATQDGTMITVFVNVENHGQRIEYISWGDFRLIDSQKKLHEDSRLFPDDGEIAPSANSDFKYIFRVSEGTQLADCQLVVLEDYNNPRYLDLS